MAKLKISFLDRVSSALGSWEGSEDTEFPGEDGPGTAPNAMASYIQFYVWLLIEYKRELVNMPFDTGNRPDALDICAVCPHNFLYHNPYCSKCTSELGHTAKHEFMVKKDTGLHPYIRGVFSEKHFATKWKKTLEEGAKHTWSTLPGWLRPFYVVEETVANHCYAGADIYSLGHVAEKEKSLRR